MEQAVDLAKQSDSTIIVLLVIVVILAIALIPLFKTFSEIGQRKRNDTYAREDMLLKREDKLLQVVERNTEVNAALKTLIEQDQKHCDECKKEQRDLFRKVFDNQETANIKLAEISQRLEV
jgi:signal transduction histidine kinase